ncbi:MAG: YppF family protein [Bacillota bacterium]|nr:YppF family protein [Bacillota bacterium]
MNIDELKERFIQNKEYTPENINELMDFAKKAYIHNEINIKEYSLLVRELEAQGAVVPESFKDSLTQNTK